VRRASRVFRHVQRLYRAQRDLLSDEAEADLLRAFADLSLATRYADTPGGPRECAERLTATAARWLVDTSKNRVREATEMLAIGLVVVVVVRTFFAQPMRIPTGSMQPTLNGVRTVDMRGRSDWRPPPTLHRLFQRVVYGRTFYHVVAKSTGRITEVEPTSPIVPWLGRLPFAQKLRFKLGEDWHTVWFPPRDLPPIYRLGPENLFLAHAGVDLRRIYQPGEDVIKLVVLAGDRMLVDRFTYNLRRPRRGDVVVFTAKGIPALQADTHYVKRLVGLGGEHVQIGDDRHARIDGRRLDARTPGFERVYAFHGPPKEDQYSGHLNDRLAQRLHNPPGLLAPLFADGQTELVVRPRHYLVLGDNTLSSLDGRRWGDFGETSVVGRAGWRYWPLRR
jgi:signal peptidase I